jgi:hypothetical protein
MALTLNATTRSASLDCAIGLWSCRSLQRSLPLLPDRVIGRSTASAGRRFVLWVVFDQAAQEFIAGIAGGRSSAGIAGGRSRQS